MKDKKNYFWPQNYSRKFWILLAITTVFILKTSAQTPTLGTYPNATAAVGANTTVTPAGAPTGVTRINVSANTNFKGTFIASPATGVVRVTDAHPAGSYLVTIKAFDNVDNSTIRTFTLTVTNGTMCNAAVQFTNQFTNNADIPTGVAPRSIAIGDFNNDGIQDIATANSFAQSVSIRFGDGFGHFSGTTNVSVGSNPYSIAIGDFNNDGNQDFATANRDTNTVSIRLGNGAGGFSGTTEISVGNRPENIAVGDFNNDGKLDFAVNDFISTISIRLGDGLGGFTAAASVSVGSIPAGIAVGDFNNDGKQDLAVANANADTVSIRLGNGLGGFSGTTNVSVGSGPTGVTIGDFNNDGKQDFTSANAGDNTVSIRLGDGLGGFSGSTNLSVGANPVNVAIGDFNYDGNQDFATANQSAGVSIRLGNGSGGFSNAADVSVGSSPFGVVIGDFNNDGKQDLAVASAGDSTISIRSGVCYIAPPPSPCVFNNGGLNPQSLSESGVAAPAGFFWSELQHDAGNNTEANTVAGVFAVRGLSRLADDFTIGQPCSLASVTFFGHEVDATPNRSPFTSYTLQIWNGRPGDPGASVIFGDTTTNRLAYSIDSTYYRILNSVVPAPGTAPRLSRKIWANTITINTTLAAGTYWLDWDSLVTDEQTHSQEPKAIAGSRGAVSDNARQLNVATGVWSNRVDGGIPDTAPDVHQDFPFQVSGATLTLATVDGRVLTSDGRGLRNATVSITDSLGVSRTATTSSFGFFSFQNVTTGQSYTIRVSSRFFRFQPRTMQVDGNLTLPDFVGLE